MDQKSKNNISKELEQFYCSILLDEVKEKVRKLKAYGIEETIIESVLEDEELFPPLIVTRDYKIILAGKQNTEIKMEPLVKAIYLLFLSHPEGIRLKELTDYREELTNLYLLLKPYGLTDRANKSIMDVTNPTFNSINEKCTRIRKAFSKVLSQSISKYYAISGKRGETKVIQLTRANVIWECKLPSQAL